MRIAVVIPTLDEADTVGAAIASARVTAAPDAKLDGEPHRGPVRGSPQGPTDGSAGGNGPGREGDLDRRLAPESEAGPRWAPEAPPDPGSPERGDLEPEDLDPGTLDRESRIEIEWIVADGGSRDATAERARAAGARVIACPRGRARQLEAGWRESRGDAVLFLHADTRLPAGWAAALCRALDDPAVSGGAFALRFEPRLPWIEWGARWRVRLLGLPYGDQGVFARRSALEAIGGVPAVPLLEDLDLVRALARRGRLAQLPLAATTSARRYRERGVLRTWLRNALTLAAWRLGVDRERLAAWYGR